SSPAVGGPARRRRGRFAKHSGAWKTVEGTEERKTVAKLLQFFQTAAQPSWLALSSANSEIKDAKLFNSLPSLEVG
ncbi:hypothetical protein ALC60_11471, partial [Trachymyrmex zeteki]